MNTCPLLIVLSALALSTSVHARDCFETHALAKGLDADLLRAIALVESSGNPNAVGKNSSSEDIGLMQINSSWLKRFNTTKKELLENVCINIEIVAEILSDNMKRLKNPWEAVGAYNAACTRLKGEDCIPARQTYAWKVYRALMSLSDAKRDKLRKVSS